MGRQGQLCDHNKKAVLQILESQELPSNFTFGAACNVWNNNGSLGEKASDTRRLCAYLFQRYKNERKLNPERYARRCFSLSVQVNHHNREAFFFFDTLASLRLPNAEEIRSNEMPNLRSASKASLGFSDPLDDMGVGVGEEYYGHGSNGKLIEESLYHIAIIFYLTNFFFNTDEFATPPARKMPSTRPRRTPSSMTSRTSTPYDPSNELGKKIVCYLHGGLVFCLFWIDSILDKNVMEIKVTDDGEGIVKRSKKPTPQNGAALLNSLYGWAKESSNFVVKQLDDEVERLKTEMASASDEWDEELLASLNEECLSDFCDVNGNKSGLIQYRQDELGRQYVCFFLKTVSSQKKATKAGVFRNTIANDGDMADDLDDEETITTQDYKEEMELRMQQQQQQFDSAMQQQQQQMNTTTEILSQLMGQLQMNKEQQQQQSEYANKQFLAQQHYNQQHQQHQQQGPQPDQSASFS
jgi:hypothetical protein